LAGFFALCGAVRPYRRSTVPPKREVEDGRRHCGSSGHGHGAGRLRCVGPPAKTMTKKAGRGTVAGPRPSVALGRPRGVGGSERVEVPDVRFQPFQVVGPVSLR
jgi:hypothetical protein